jgi:hypothetical protein
MADWEAYKHDFPRTNGVEGGLPNTHKLFHNCVGPSSCPEEQQWKRDRHEHHWLELCLIKLPCRAIWTVTAYIWTNSVTVKVEAVHSSEMLEHLTITQCRNPKEDHHLMTSLLGRYIAKDHRLSSLVELGYLLQNLRFKCFVCVCIGAVQSIVGFWAKVVTFQRLMLNKQKSLVGGVGVSQVDSVIIVQVVWESLVLFDSNTTS